MPTEGKFYNNNELQEILNVTKQAIDQLANRQNWVTLDARYCAEDVEDYLKMRGINIESFPIRTHSHPEGTTWVQLEKEFDNDNKTQTD